MMEWDEQGQRISDDTFLLLFNADAHPVEFTLPGDRSDIRWVIVLTTEDPRIQEGTRTELPGNRISLEGRSVALFKRLE